MIGAVFIIVTLLSGWLASKGKIRLEVHKILAIIAALILFVHSYLVLRNFI
jgi:hypothetical protein